MRPIAGKAGRIKHEGSRAREREDNTKGFGFTKAEGLLSLISLVCQQSNLFKSASLAVTGTEIRVTSKALPKQKLFGISTRCENILKT